MEQIGFIGVGSIGNPMARRLLSCGYKLTVCDKNSEALKSFKEQGVSVTDNPSDCAGSEMIIVIVANDTQVNEAVLPPNGLLASVDPNRPPLLALMSTVLPQTIQELSQRCKEKNVCMVDAPVSGFPTRAEQGTLSIMVGGEASDLDAMRPVFEDLGENIYHAGALGSGEVSKLVNNILGITNMFLSVEAMSIGQKWGMDPEKLAAIIETSSGRNFSSKDWKKARAVFGAFSKTMDLTKVLVDLCQKDLEHARQLAQNVDMVCPLLDQVVDTVNNFTYEEINERWGSAS